LTITRSAVWDLLGQARAVQVEDVAEPVAALEVARHAPDRGDPAARADEQSAPGERVGQAKLALDLAE
jgi:hypothetical protein